MLHKKSLSISSSLRKKVAKSCGVRGQGSVPTNGDTTISACTRVDIQPIRGTKVHWLVGCLQIKPIHVLDVLNVLDVLALLNEPEARSTWATRLQLASMALVLQTMSWMDSTPDPCVSFSKWTVAPVYKDKLGVYYLGYVDEHTWKSVSGPLCAHVHNIL